LAITFVNKDLYLFIYYLFIYIIVNNEIF
jgi:hypothetical protein